MPRPMLRIALVAAALAARAVPARAQVLPAFGEDRAGTSGFQFLKVPVDPRGAALGEASVVTASDAAALFWNPALAAQGGGTEVGIATAAYHADVALHYAAGYRRVGPVTIGLSLQALDSGEMAVTDEFNPDGTGETFAVTDVAAGVTVAQALTDLFSYGVTAKYVRESIAGVTSQTALLDLGIFYQVGDTGVELGVAIRNFGGDATPSGSITRQTIDGPVEETEFQGIHPPTTFLMGASWRPFRTGAARDLTFVGQLTRPNDNAERFNVGAEYVWNELLSLRAGYRFGVDEGNLPSFGAGLRVPGLGSGRDLRIDYAFTSLERLGAVHRIGVNLRLP